MSTPDPDPSPGQNADGERIYLTLRQAHEEGPLRMARLLGCKGDDRLFRSERDLVRRCRRE